jgi:hypothetical protein
MDECLQRCDRCDFEAGSRIAVVSEEPRAAQRGAVQARYIPPIWLAGQE